MDTNQTQNISNTPENITLMKLNEVGNIQANKEKLLNSKINTPNMEMKTTLKILFPQQEDAKKTPVAVMQQFGKQMISTQLQQHQQKSTRVDEQAQKKSVNQEETKQMAPAQKQYDEQMQEAQQSQAPMPTQRKYQHRQPKPKSTSFITKALIYGGVAAGGLVALPIGFTVLFG